MFKPVLPFEDKAWKRFNHYASLTRNLKICELDIHPAIFSALCMRSQIGLMSIPPSPLFPRLESLSVGLAFPQIPEDLDLSDGDEESESLKIISATLLPFLTPGIRQLSINGSICDDIGSKNFKSLPLILKSFLPNLDALHLTHAHTSRHHVYTNVDLYCPAEVPLAHDLLMQSRTWKTFQLQSDYMSTSVLRYLLSLPCFHTLSLSIDWITIDTDDQPMSRKIGNLRPLSVLLNTSSQFVTIKILEQLQYRPLEEISLNIALKRDDEDLGNLIQTLINYCSPQTTTKLKLGLTGDDIQAHTMDDFSPLFSFRNLQELVLSETPFKFTDENLKLLADAYKDIKVLHLPGSDPRHSTESLTILLTDCAKLVELGISFLGTAGVSSDAIRDVAWKASKEVFRVCYIGDLGVKGEEASNRFIVRLESFGI